MFDRRFGDRDLNVESKQKPQDPNNVRSQIVGHPTVLVLGVNDRRHFFSGKFGNPGSPEN